MPINCDCTDAPAYRTLAQLRAAMLARLGFVDPLANPVMRSLGDIRNSMLYLLGYGAQVATPPPGVANAVNQFINDAQQALSRRIEMDRGALAAPPLMVADADLTTLDYLPVQTLAMAMFCAHKAKPEAKAYFEQHEKYVGDVAARRPPGLVAMLNSFLAEAQSSLIRRYPQLHTARWFSWPLTASERFYALATNAEQTVAPVCTKKIDPLRISDVLIERGTQRRRMLRGIPNTQISRQVSGWPSHFDIGACIEIWPAPLATDGTLLVKAHNLPTPFVADTDVPTVDDHAVLLFALGKAKAHYKQPDARDVIGELEVYLQSLTAGTHGAARYIPGQRRESTYVQPIPTTPFV